MVLPTVAVLPHGHFLAPAPAARASFCLRAEKMKECALSDERIHKKWIANAPTITAYCVRNATL